jgi:hypothetical protein
MPTCLKDDCPHAMRCSKCGKKLCHGHTEDGHRYIEGHFAIDDDTFCVMCWDQMRSLERK